MKYTRFTLVKDTSGIYIDRYRVRVYDSRFFGLWNTCIEDTIFFTTSSLDNYVIHTDRVILDNGFTPSMLPHNSSQVPVVKKENNNEVIMELTAPGQLTGSENV